METPGKLIPKIFQNTMKFLLLNIFRVMRVESYNTVSNVASFGIGIIFKNSTEKLDRCLMTFRRRNNDTSRSTVDYIIK